MVVEGRLFRAWEMFFSHMPPTCRRFDKYTEECRLMPSRASCRCVTPSAPPVTAPAAPALVGGYSH